MFSYESGTEGNHLYSGNSQVPSDQGSSIYQSGNARIFYLWITETATTINIICSLITMRLCNAFILDLFYMQLLLFNTQIKEELKLRPTCMETYSFYPICFLRKWIPIIDMKWYSFSHLTPRKQLSTVLTIVDLFLQGTFGI